MAEKDLNSELKELRKDFAKLSSTISSFAVTALERGKNEYKKDYNLAKDTLITNSKKTYDTVEKTLSDKPFITLVSAFGVGILLGGIISRRNNRHKE